MLPVIDSHVHVWNAGSPAMGWLQRDPLFADIRRSFTLSDLIDRLDSRAVGGAVLVQAVPYVDETVELLSIAASSTRVLGVVGWVNMDSAALTRDDLARLADRTDCNPLVGIRHLGTGDHKDALFDGRITDSAQVLLEHGLTLDVHIPDARSLGAVVRFARTAPDLRIVLNHLGRPDFNHGLDMVEWTQGIASLGKLPNVHVKYSGWSTRLGHPDPETVRPYAETVLDCFGQDRVLFASNWPVALVSGSYEETFDASVKAVERLDPDALGRLFYHNARRAYQLQ